jgi:hypothetical protein
MTMVRPPRPSGATAAATGRRCHRRGARQPSRHAEAVGLDSHPGFGLQVADVVRLRPVRGDQPEGIAVQPVSLRGMPRQPGTAAGRFQQRERAGRQARAHGNADQPVTGPLQRGDHTVLPRAHLPVVPPAPRPVNAGTGTRRGQITMRARHRGREPRASPPIWRQVSVGRRAVRAAPERTLCGPAGRVIAGHPSDSVGGGRRAVMPEAAEPRAGGVSACSGSHVCLVAVSCGVRRHHVSIVNQGRPGCSALDRPYVIFYWGVVGADLGFYRLVGALGELRSWLRWLRCVEAERDRLAEQIEYAALFRGRC